VASTGNPAAGPAIPGVDAGDPRVDGGDQGIDGGNPGIDAGSRSLDASSSAPLSQLVDQQGTPVHLKGVSSQWLQWEFRPYAESTGGLKYMRDNWKVSVIRAAMGVDASVGGYMVSPASLKQQVEAIIHNAIDLGVYVLVDWHTEQAVIEQDAAVAFFTEMATKYGAYPNVIWEPYNEPKGYAWSQIKPYHEAVVAAIRAVDPDNPIVLGTPNWSQRVDQAAADPVAGTNLLYSLHWYSCTHGQMFRDYAVTAIAQGIALFVTEFGATFSDGGTGSHYFVCEDEANLWFTWMSQNDVSGVAWKLDQCTDTLCLLNATAPLDGPWPDDKLSTNAGGALYTGTFGGGVSGTGIQGGQGRFIVDWLRQ
jgi:endoglucanase